jgi:hypothetical protein
MELNLDNLPEKNYFSIEEVAQRWGCDTETIEHFIYDQKTLRLALRVADHSLLALVKNSSQSTLNTLVSLADKIYIKYLYQLATDLSRSEIVTRVINLSNALDKETLRSYVDELDLKSLRNEELDKPYLPKFLYQDEADIVQNDKFTPSGIDPKYNSYLVSAQDFENNCYLLLSPCISFMQVIHPFMFDIITKEERDRFEDKYDIRNEAESVRKKIGQSEINKHLPNIANGSIQASRELVLKGWLVGRGIDFGTEANLTRPQLWNELSKASPELFRSLGKDAIDDFFGLQKLCAFRRGRPKGGI